MSCRLGNDLGRVRERWKRKKEKKKKKKKKEKKKKKKNLFPCEEDVDLATPNIIVHYFLCQKFSCVEV